MPRLTPQEMKIEIEETIPVYIFPPFLDIPFIDGIGDEMEIGDCGEARICLPGYDIFFPEGR